MADLYLARSAADEDTPAQSYLEHVLNVLEQGRRYLGEVLRYAPDWDAELVCRIFELAAEYHDLGKLNKDNQKTLALPWNKRAAQLPLAHADAGVSHLMSLEVYQALLLVYSHHVGLPDCNAVTDWRNERVKKLVDLELEDYLAHHDANVRSKIRFKEPPKNVATLTPQDVRVLFSCLTHADHGDAAGAFHGLQKRQEAPKLRANERLEALKQYVEGLASSGEDSDRNRLRAAFFVDCTQGTQGDAIIYCDAPVGTGKTTAVMAHLLVTAARHNLRRIFVVLPFTNIITQSVEVYRKALVLPGERPDDVVAEIHHRADFEDMASRKLTALWDAPIVVTTAVTFFETLASSTPSTLRRLQNLPGSAIFLDEAHAMLPTKLLPLAWKWIKHAASAWSCRWVLASGSLCHFWTLEEFDDSREQLSNILTDGQQKKLQNFESVRISYRYKPDLMSIDDLVAWLKQLEGPVIVVLNTVHTVAAVAKAAKRVFGEGNILHLSTALSPNDRTKTLDLLKLRLKDKESTNWCLIATSCVEAGVDLSFKTGVRECASLLSLLQLAGRVNRNAEYEESDVWTVMLSKTSTNVVKHPAFNVSSRILTDFFKKGVKISPDLSTEAMQKEIREGGTNFNENSLIKQEGVYAFKTVEKEFKVIEDDTQLAVVDKELIQRIRNFEDVSWRDIQLNSVRVRKKTLTMLSIQESCRYPGVWLWDAGYSPFLGYMEAVLEMKEVDEDGFAII